METVNRSQNVIYRTSLIAVNSSEVSVTPARVNGNNQGLLTWCDCNCDLLLIATSMQRPKETLIARNQVINSNQTRNLITREKFYASGCCVLTVIGCVAFNFNVEIAPCGKTILCDRTIILVAIALCKLAFKSCWHHVVATAIFYCI